MEISETKEEKPRYALLSGFKKWLGIINDILLVPMFASFIMEATESGFELSTKSNLFFCGLFFTEWMLGLLLVEDRKSYVSRPTRILDLISTLPIGGYFQGLRLFRLTRLVKLLRVVLRVKRYSGPGRDLMRVVAVVGATTFAGAYTILIVEGGGIAPDGTEITINSFGDALWWALVTISTVGYGDMYPVTTGGRLVAVCLILIGVGVCGYIAGFMANLMSLGEEDDEDRHLARVEKKLDILAEHLNISGWPSREDDE